MLVPEVTYLLDTNILLALARRGNLGQYLLATYPLLTTTAIPMISYVTEAEVRSIARYNGWGAKSLHELAFLLATFRRVFIHEHGILEAYVAIDFFGRTNGFKFGKNDLWIAATASATAATLLTTDKDFDSLNPLFLSRVWVDPNQKP